MVLLPLAISFLVLSGLLYLSLRREPTELNELLSFVISFVLIMLISFLLELLYDVKDIMMVWNVTYYIGFVGALICIIIFSMKVLDMRFWLRPKHIWIILAVPVLCLVLLMTDPFLGLYYESIDVAGFGPFLYLKTTPGIGFYLFMVFGIILVLFLLHALIKEYFSAVKPNLDSIIVLLFIPVILNLNLFTVHLLGQPLPSTYSSMILTTALIVIFYVFTKHMEVRVSSPTYRHVLKDLETGIVVLDMKDHILYLNREARKNLGLNKGEKLPVHLQDLVMSHLDDITSQEVRFDVEGKRRYFDVKIENLKDGEEQCKARLVIMNDVTDQVVARENLLGIQEKLTILSSITKHDIANQLAVILGYGELLRDHPGIDETCLHRLDAMMRAAESIRLQTEFMRDYQNVGKNLPQWQSLSEMLHRGFEQMDTGEIGFLFEGEEVEIFADPMLEKVFMNLIGNTVQHSQNATSVVTSLDEMGEHLLIIYTDDGVGIPVEEKELIFDSDFGKGTGLGLFLSRTILKMTDMEIWEEGEPSKGVRFVIRVPSEGYRFVSNS